ncbi:MAG: acylphosphatase [Deltaproteobacteria bacterium]|nr:acylphosphatase [Deltaproteobacteria bacterium]
MSEEGSRRVGVVVRGRVQGVGYRASTRYQAQELGLRGWVANQADGSVALEAEGPSAAVDALIAWCHRGPSLAAVSAVEVAELAVVGDAGFVIKR